MILWWTTLIAILGSMGTILLSIMMLAHVGSETDPRAIFWFFVAACATGVLILAIRAENSPAMRSVSWRSTKSAAIRRPAPVSKPATVQSKYWIVYHGTPTWTNAAGAIQNGFVPGPGNKFGTGVYTTFDYRSGAVVCAWGRVCVQALYQPQNAVRLLQPNSRHKH